MYKIQKSSNSFYGQTDDLFDNYSQDVPQYDCYIEQSENFKKKTRQEKLYKLGTTVCTIGGVTVLGGRIIKLISHIFKD